MPSIVGTIISAGARSLGLPYVAAMVIAAALAIGVPVGGIRLWLYVHDGKVAARATAQCEAEERARVLAAQNAALEAALFDAERTLRVRSEALSTSERRINQLEEDAEWLRGTVQQKDGSGACAVVFDADDPWLQRKPRRAETGPRR